MSRFSPENTACKISLWRDFQMLLFNDSKYLKTPFQNEAELEKIIVTNYEYLFGPASLYLPKSKIVTADGFGTIPDGFVIDLDNRIWYIVEAELIRHGVYEHIVPQITKQLNAASQTEAKRKIEGLTVEQYSNDQTVKEKFVEAQIREIDIRKVLGDILSKPPVVGVPIDEVNGDLRDYSKTIKNGMRIWIVSKYVELGNPVNIIYEFPEEYKPEIDTEEVADNETSAKNHFVPYRIRQADRYTVTVSDLLKCGALAQEDKVFMVYKPRDGQAKKYEAIILSDGSLSMLEQTFGSPSNAAIAGIQDAGSERKTVNGWTAWKTKEGKTLAELRDDFINRQESSLLNDAP
jgi:hypothetical protein